MTSISTLSFNTTTRTSLMRLQGEVNDLAQQMNNGGRLNDVGRALGRLTGSAISARSLGESLDEQQTSNGLLDTRLKNIEAALDAMKTSAEGVANNLIGVSVGKDWANMVQQAKDGLAGMTSRLNGADSGSYIFGGIQTDTPPIDLGKAAAAKSTAAAHFDAFVAAANTAAARTVPGNALPASLVTDTEMKAYLTTGFTAGTPPVTYKYSELFNGLTPGAAPADPVANPAVAAAYTNWDDNWSDASSDKGQSRISGTESVTTMASANDAAFRKMISGYSMLTDLNIAGLNDATRTVVLEAANGALKAASTAVTAIGAEIGTTRKRIDTANVELKRQQDIMTNTVDALEVEDTTEISTKVLNLKTQLEVAYTVTGKIQNLSLLNYL